MSKNLKPATTPLPAPLVEAEAPDELGANNVLFEGAGVRMYAPNVVQTTTTPPPLPATSLGACGYRWRHRVAPPAPPPAAPPAPLPAAPPVPAPSPPAALDVPREVVLAAGGWPEALDRLRLRGALSPQVGAELAPVHEQLLPLVAQAHAAPAGGTVRMPGALAATLREWATWIEIARGSGIAFTLEQQLADRAAIDCFVTRGA